jgi:3-deoxy-D-manno-octulosonic-acid transferase
MNHWLHRYHRVTDAIYRSSLLATCGVAQARIDAFRAPHAQRLSDTNDSVTWFHAASVGELEILMPLIQKMIENKTKIAVSVFSESAILALKKISEQCVYVGFSPKESDWLTTLQKFRVDRVIVSKYEAWPGLWAACTELNVPLVLINAQVRSSLRWVKRFLSLFQIAMPRLYLFTADRNEMRALQNLFPSAQIETVADPRWVRVIERSKNSFHHPKVEAYRNEYQTQPRPYGMVGSAWIEDLQVLVTAWIEAGCAGTLWVVPHSLAVENIEKMRADLNDKISGRFVLVTEMGILAELYSLADWVWVGGGYGRGIHSTLEPAVFGVPIACGPKRVNEFYETRELRQHGLLTVCANKQDAKKWLSIFQAVKPLALAEKTDGFARLVERCLHLT